MFIYFLVFSTNVPYGVHYHTKKPYNRLFCNCCSQCVCFSLLLLLYPWSFLMRTIIITITTTDVASSLVFSFFTLSHVNASLLVTLFLSLYIVYLHIFSFSLLNILKLIKTKKEKIVNKHEKREQHNSNLTFITK